jgi:hypothetical protein
MNVTGRGGHGGAAQPTPSATDTDSLEYTETTALPGLASSAASSAA